VLRVRRPKVPNLEVAECEHSGLFHLIWTRREEGVTEGDARGVLYSVAFAMWDGDLSGCNFSRLLLLSLRGV